MAANTGFVNVGTDHNTAALAVESIRRWWHLIGRDAYPHATRLLITCDAGGSNGWRNRAWKAGLAALAQETGLDVTCCHFPPGTSKWNKIEHRLFSQITLNWRGRPLTSHDVIINTIGAVTTSTGLAVTAVLDEGRYPTGTQISGEQMRNLEQHVLTRHRFHGDWNYTLHPAPVTPPRPPAPPVLTPAAAASAALAPVVAALASPELTGLSRQDLAALAASLGLSHAAAREQRLHLDRGHSRRARTGPAAPFKYPLQTQLLAAIYHHRLAMPCTHIAAMPGAHHTTITPAVQAVTALPGPGHPVLAPGPARLRTPDDLRRHAAAAGSPSQTPRHPDASANSTRSTCDTPQTHFILERFWGMRILRRDHFLHVNSRLCSGFVRGLAGRDDGDVGGGDFAAFVVEVADVDRAVGAAHPAEHAGALGAGQVLVTPLLQRAEDHLEFPADRGEPVREAGPGAGLAVRLAGHDAVLDQGG